MVIIIADRSVKNLSSNTICCMILSSYKLPLFSVVGQPGVIRFRQCEKLLGFVFTLSGHRHGTWVVLSKHNPIATVLRRWHCNYSVLNILFFINIFDLQLYISFTYKKYTYIC